MKIYQAIEANLAPEPNCAKTLGLEVLSFNPETLEIHLAFDGKKEFTNPTGNIQGGFLCAMLDDTMGPALTFSLNVGQFAPTLELKTQFIKPAKVGRIEGRGRVVSKGNQICFLEGELYQDDSLVVKGTATAVIRELKR